MEETEEKRMTLEDLEIRCKGLRKAGAPDCTFEGCKNPIDHTEGMGWDTSCPYHRLLFDYWFYKIKICLIEPDKEKRRKEFYDWTIKTGKEKCDSLVLDMANDFINWKC